MAISQSEWDKFSGDRINYIYLRCDFKSITEYTQHTRLRASKLYITCSYFKSLKFFRTPILEPFGESFRENLLIKSRNQNILKILN